MKTSAQNWVKTANKPFILLLNLKKRWALFYSTSWNLLNSLNSNTALRLLQILNDFEPNVTGFYKVPVCNISNNVVYLFIFLQVWHEGKQINVTSIVVTELPLIQRRWFTMKSKYGKRYAFLLHLYTYHLVQEKILKFGPWKKGRTKF